ncbi:Uncharacterised protein [Bordetella pertussis]|nr:Uncharacterised protein [Bordetella pertussis]
MASVNWSRRPSYVRPLRKAQMLLSKCSGISGTLSSAIWVDCCSSFSRLATSTVTRASVNTLSNLALEKPP